jgi:hypothetical protein
MADAAAPSSPPRAAETAGEASLRVVCTPEEERIFATLLAAVRHFGARAFCLASSLRCSRGLCFLARR